MIVKDEASIIRRCLDSAKTVIDSWCIVDTGSTDGTQGIIREHMAGIPGELHERPWVDFAHNRSEAIELARPLADWLLLLDADEVLEASCPFEPVADEIVTTHLQAGGEFAFLRTTFIRASLPFRYEGVVHEAVVCDEPHSAGQLHGWTVTYHPDGARNGDPQKYERDIEVLRTVLEKDPANARYRFYFAQSFRDAGRPFEAINEYQNRVKLGGWQEEVWYSLFQIAVLFERVGRDPTQNYLRAFQYRPSRPEPMVELARWNRAAGNFELCYWFAKIAAEIPRTKDGLFVDTSSPWRALDELALGAYYTGRKDEFAIITQKLLKVCPEHARHRIEQNATYACL
jgi:glycosyltransferase involved in cell wall biosynthesis